MSLSFLSGIFLIFLKLVSLLVILFFFNIMQDNFIICANCFKSGNYGEKRSAEDFVLSESSENSGKHDTVWTEGEILLLLESVLKHGDDWELVAQSVQTKTKLDCISKLIELPFGELMLGPAHRNVNVNSANGIVVNNTKQVQSSSSDYQEISKTKDQPPELTNENEQNGDATKESPSKRQRVTPLSDSSGSLMNQVVLNFMSFVIHVTYKFSNLLHSLFVDSLWSYLMCNIFGFCERLISYLFTVCKCLFWPFHL